MRFSDPGPDCRFDDDGSCWRHYAIGMVQIFSVKVGSLPADAGSIELYGYIAARDQQDPFLNYVVNISRDDPIVVEEGSLVDMAGPKRGIQLMDNTLIEYDMRIKRGEQEQDDLQMLDGASILGFIGPWNYPFKLDTPGDYGTIDIILSPIRWAVEATVKRNQNYAFCPTKPNPNPLPPSPRAAALCRTGAPPAAARVPLPTPSLPSAAAEGAAEQSSRGVAAAGLLLVAAGLGDGGARSRALRWWCVATAAGGAATGGQMAVGWLGSIWSRMGLEGPELLYHVPARVASMVCGSARITWASGRRPRPWRRPPPSAGDGQQDMVDLGISCLAE
ncbi:hypothetical protein QYE76_036486 [Lolium multiflorum]|uniref:DUF6598 domain-containing protein n=1 Tax=Lolium multiflorum TaxID=4521 RepID=A0AAD8VQ69_LOLMU|nr:hypothetical protein QYE76_036486 [Lolium multiflorum]